MKKLFAALLFLLAGFSWAGSYAPPAWPVGTPTHDIPVHLNGFSNVVLWEETTPVTTPAGPTPTPTATELYSYGYALVGGNTSGTSSKLQAVKYSLPDGGVVTDLNVYCISGAGQSIIMGVYDDLGVMPFRLVIGTHGQVAVNGWNKFTVDKVTLPPGDYWIAMEGNVQVQWGAAGGKYFYIAASYTDPLPCLAVTDNPSYDVGINLSMYFNAMPLSPLYKTTTPTFTPSAGTPTATPTFTSIVYPISDNPNNGFLLPPMGWDDFSHPGPANTTETIVHGVAQTMIANGLLASGYTGIYLDAGWDSSARVNGHRVFDPPRFPSGGTALASYLHGNGFKLGLYTSTGTIDCIGYTGAQGYEQQDINDMASWGIDYLSMDTCGSVTNVYASYRAVHDAIINPTPFRNMFFAICNQAGPDVHFIPSLANMWRTGADGDNTWASFLYNIDRNGLFASYSKPGQINQPFFFFIGGGSLTTTEEASAMSLYCEMASPLIFAGYPLSMGASSVSILNNTEAIAVDQDPLVSQGVTVSSSQGGLCQVFSKVMTGTNVRAVALFNRDSVSQPVTVTFTDCDLPSNQSYTVRDLWSHTNVGNYAISYSATVPSHGTKLLKLTPFQQ